MVEKIIYTLTGSRGKSHWKGFCLLVYIILDSSKEGIQILRLKNVKFEDSTSHDSLCQGGLTCDIKTYNIVLNCIRQTKNWEATFAWIAKRLQKQAQIGF